MANASAAPSAGSGSCARSTASTPTGGCEPRLGVGDGAGAHCQRVCNVPGLNRTPSVRRGGSLPKSLKRFGYATGRPHRLPPTVLGVTMVSTDDVLAVVSRSPQNWGRGRHEWLVEQVAELGATPDEL